MLCGEGCISAQSNAFVLLFSKENVGGEFSLI